MALLTSTNGSPHHGSILKKTVQDYHVSLGVATAVKDGEKQHNHSNLLLALPCKFLMLFMLIRIRS